MNIYSMIVLLGIVVVFYLLTTYNKFKTVEVRITASIQEIGNQLKRQAELIPNLVASVKGYFKHETGALKMITDARTSILSALKSGSSQKMIDAASQLQSALGGINVVMESTPELKAVGPTQDLMNELRDTADKVMYSRRTLIDLTADYNTMVETVPSSLVAGLFKFQAKEGLKTTEAETKTPKVEL